MTVGLIIQAHRNSTRLPNKINLYLGNTTLLERVLENCYFTIADKVIVATTSSISNDSILYTVRKVNERLCSDVIVFRYDGNENDLLSRYYHCAKKYGLSIIVRITGDCPFINGDIINLCIKLHAVTEADIFDFTDIDGLEVQVVTFQALEKAHKEAVSDYDREHVFPYLYEHPEQFVIKHLKETKISIDTKSDMEFARKVSSYQT